MQMHKVFFTNGIILTLKKYSSIDGCTARRMSNLKLPSWSPDANLHQALRQ
ncbi:uncharacterized protein LACBIDRAFT_306620 [Laccaria bicolor S238N-H82]|uniref:Predicted protein n=1 Tax=Laccaria bicolor (strain S238N-H82 / ATCC MYA-4686) TaxID=486041 RepID=B0DNG0_LACBS|nr:uncharacterized protein LACBIDRAFT_306620 [Laccaria bicolor S238N-H82]EDR03933.1 predicted protein [Laccaria bicolor S238N-H82]|eukprot:XP_001885501.1 predicted protein [Laccaria bicolor S238N-H82]